MERIVAENKELKGRLSTLEQEEKDQFDDIRKKLGIDFSV